MRDHIVHGATALGAAAASIGVTLANVDAAIRYVTDIGAAIAVGWSLLNTYRAWKAGRAEK